MSGRPDRLRAAVGVLGELLITAGLVVGLFAVYTLYWTGVETANAQDALAEEFAALPQQTDGSDLAAQESEQSDEAEVEATLGSAYARITIPRLGENWSWIIVQGVTTDDLTRGPGHYPGTADPGEVGNFAVAGHRATYGEPFAYLDQVQVGDDIFVERAGMMYRYVVTESFITLPNDVAVIAPVPGRPGEQPTEQIITLTTCHPRFSGAERMIVHGTLADATPVTAQAAGGSAQESDA
jgi:sortase A